MGSRFDNSNFGMTGEIKDLFDKVESVLELLTWIYYNVAVYIVFIAYVSQVLNWHFCPEVHLKNLHENHPAIYSVIYFLIAPVRSLFQVFACSLRDGVRF